jgi:hypothetical protein
MAPQAASSGHVRQRSMGSQCHPSLPSHAPVTAWLLGLEESGIVEMLHCTPENALSTMHG